MVFLGLSCWFSYAVYILNQTSIYAENGWLENTQVFTLAIACFVFFLPVVYQKRKDRLILTFFSLLCFNFILREVDVEELNIPNILILIGSGIGRKLLLVIGFASIFFYALLNRVQYINETKKFITSRKSVMMGLAALFLFSSGYFEEARSIPHRMFVEEMVELIGYVLILLVAILYSKKV